LFEQPDIVRLFRDCGAKVEIEEPRIEDYQEAHRRACLHLPPHAPDKKSDEMRDLVIWMIALRLAGEHRDVILLSRDEVHTHTRGDDEATEAGMRRIRSVDELLEILGLETPSTRLAAALLEPIWSDLVATGLPFLQVLKVDNAFFTTGTSGIERASFDFVAKGDNGSTIEAHINIEITNGAITRADLKQVIVDGQPWQNGSAEIFTNKPVAAAQVLSNVNEQIDDLREVIGG